MEEVGLSERDSVPGIRYIYYKVLWQVVPNMSEEQQRPISRECGSRRKKSPWDPGDCAICSPRIAELLKGSVQEVMYDHTLQATLLLGGGGSR